MTQKQKNWFWVAAVLVIAATLLFIFGRGMVFAQSGSAGWYTFENNVRAQQDVDIWDDLTVGDDVSVSGNATVAGLVVTSKQAYAPAVNFSLLPTASYIEVTAAITAGGVLSTTGIAEGTVVNIVNVGSNTVTFTDTSTTMLSGNAALGQYDTLTVVFDGTNWLETAQANN